MNRHQQDAIEYLLAEDRVLLEQLGGKPRRFVYATHHPRGAEALNAAEWRVARAFRSIV